MCQHQLKWPFKWGFKEFAIRYFIVFFDVFLSNCDLFLSCSTSKVQCGKILPSGGPISDCSIPMSPLFYVREEINWERRPKRRDLAHFLLLRRRFIWTTSMVTLRTVSKAISSPNGIYCTLMRAVYKRLRFEFSLDCSTLEVASGTGVHSSSQVCQRTTVTCAPKTWIPCQRYVFFVGLFEDVSVHSQYLTIAELSTPGFLVEMLTL